MRLELGIVLRNFICVFQKREQPLPAGAISNILIHMRKRRIKETKQISINPYTFQAKTDEHRGHIQRERALNVSMYMQSLHTR